MRKITALFLIGILLCSGISAPVFAAANDKAYSKASDEAVFNKVGDWFATRGKSDTEAKAIIAQRKAARATAKAQKMAEKKKKEMAKKSKAAKKSMNKKTKKMF